jgi:Na+-driven multidrug efflux pump
LFITWGRILSIGVPAAAANILLPISMGVITRLVSVFGTDAVAGFGAATRIESFALVFTLAVSMIITPFVGQNQGAGNTSRVRKSHQVASLFSIGWGVMVLVVFLAAAGPIAELFNEDPEVVRVGALYLTTVALSYGFLGIVNITAAAFNGLKKPLAAAAVAGVRLFVLLIPLAYVGRSLFGLAGIFWGVAVGNVVAGVIAFFWFSRDRRRYAQPAGDGQDAAREQEGVGSASPEIPQPMAARGARSPEPGS